MKSFLPASRPESTIAIVGASGAGCQVEPQSFALPDTYGQSCALVSLLPVASTGASTVTTRPGTFASRMIHLALRSTATPLITERRFETVPPSPRPFAANAEAAADVPPVAWMITCSRWLPFARACLSRAGGTYVDCLDVRGLAVRVAVTSASLVWPFPGSARAARGAQSAKAATRTAAPKRPPRPQSALERRSPPRFPDPQSALPRVPLMWLPAFAMTLDPFCALAEGNVRRFLESNAALVLGLNLQPPLAGSLPLMGVSAGP